MVFDLPQIIGDKPYIVRSEKTRDLYFKDRLAFLILHRNTIEIRCDKRLSQVLRNKYESVMESRYFGQGGIEIVLTGQLSQPEIEDLIRLSYTITQ